MKINYPRLFFTVVFTSVTLSIGLTASAVPFEGSKIVIATNSPHAVQAGKKVAQAGGNAVDVAVATALALSVVSPYYAGLGGGGFAVVKQGKGPVEALDFREKAPLKTNPEYYLKLPANASLDGANSVGVPGMPAGLWELHKKYGKLSWSQVLAEPIRLATEGWALSGEFVTNVKRAQDYLDATGKRTFMQNAGKTHYSPGQVFKYPKMASVLKEMRSRNIVSFYNGEVARDMVATVKKTGGVLSLEDLRKYKVRWLKPIKTNFRGHALYMMPPPSSGGVVLQQAFYLAEAAGLINQPAYSVSELHLMGEVMARSFRARELLGDPDFFENPLPKILNTTYLQKMSKTIDANKVTKLTQVMDTEELETTHLSVLDKEGNSVAMTLTVNRNFGSGVVTDQYGIVMNNQMDDFMSRPGQPNLYGLIQGSNNEIRPEKRPLSSMTPTLIEYNGKIIGSIGAQGGPRIISGLFQSIYRMLAQDMDVEKAISSPRVHQQFLPHVLYVDEKMFSPDVIEALKKKGHSIEEGWMGRVYGVRLTRDGVLTAAGDPRGEAAAGGY